MWLCTQLGFFSIVKMGGPDTWQIRARDPVDLRKLICATKLPRAIVNTPQAEYCCRVTVNYTELKQVFAVFAESIDYDNFKARIHELPDQQSKSAAYADFWQAMQAHQQERIRQMT